MTVIRSEEQRDFESVFRINALAFDADTEAKLVELLRKVEGYISLVAEKDGQIIGHISFTPVRLGDQKTAFAGLAPMSVLPKYQNQGIGSQLVEAGLQACREAGFTAVFVLGHPGYYPRFGFQIARPKGFSCEYPSQDEAFMVLELVDGALDGKQGLIKYDPAFAGF